MTMIKMSSGNYEVLQGCRKVRPLVQAAVKNAPPPLKIPLLIAGGVAIIGAAVVISIGEIFEKKNKDTESDKNESSKQ